jgi:hypothetical protein
LAAWATPTRAVAPVLLDRTTPLLLDSIDAVFDDRLASDIPVDIKMDDIVKAVSVAAFSIIPSLPR